eukprot:Hpha_TRINITY_DN16914_c1_g1::TRINITY_DN16914_c1_g1_i13::g.53926::m.53926
MRTAPLICLAALLGRAAGSAGCDTAWAKIVGGGDCFIGEKGLEKPERWGWNNQIDIADGESTSLKLWAGAGQCITSKGVHVGWLQVTRRGGLVTVCYAPFNGVTLTETHLYVGTGPWWLKKAGKKTVKTVAPGQFPFPLIPGQMCTSTQVTSPFYVQAHADACGSPTATSPPSTPGTPFPTASTPSPTASTPSPTLDVGTSPPIFIPRVDTPSPTVDLKIGFTPSPTAPSCPVQMFSNRSAGSGPDAFLDECTCGEFTCDSPTSPWSSRDYRFCGSCPEYLNGAYHFSCPHCATSGTDLSFTCPNDWEACDVFVSVYSNCATGDTDGGLAYNLASEGWSPGSCGPSFCLNFNDTCQSPSTNAVTQESDTNIKFKMILFHKQAGGGDEISIPELSTDPTMYFTFFVKQGRFCSNDKNQTECLEQPGLCKWDAGRADSCYAEICPPAVPPPPGVRACCDVAPGVESGECAAAATAITSICEFNLPQCS